MLLGSATEKQNGHYSRFPSANEAIFTLLPRRNGTNNAADNQPVYTIQDPFYISGSFEVTGPNTIDIIDIRLFTVSGDARALGEQSGVAASIGADATLDPRTGNVWQSPAYDFLLTDYIVNSPSQITFFNPGVNVNPNGVERREVTVDFGTNIFTNTSPLLTVSAVDGVGMCTRFPNPNGNNFDCDGQSNPPLNQPGRFNDTSSEDLDDPLFRVLFIPNPTNAGGTGNFERERFTLNGPGAGQGTFLGPSNAVVRQTPAGFSALALAPLAFLRTLRRRYAVLTKEDRQA